MEEGYFINSKRITEEELSDYSGISVRTIAKMRNDEAYKSRLGTVCALCVGLNLPPMFSRDMLRKAKLGFPNTAEGYFQEKILETFYLEKIMDVNRILKDHGIKAWEN